MDKVTFFALVEMDLGDRIVAPGDLVPEASDWKHLDVYLANRKLAPVLVSTLPAADKPGAKKSSKRAITSSSS